jgi:3-hydroxybutyryl-CoA dehydrogenase
MAPAPGPRGRENPADRGRLVIVGAGLMGSQIAVEFAVRGFRVDVLARDQTGAEERVRQAFTSAVDLDLTDQASAADGRRAMSISARIETLPDSADLVLECLPEDFELKVRIVRDVIQLVDCPLIATNTASIPVTDLAEGIGAADRTLGMHYWNPPVLMPLVEVTPGRRTSRDAIEAAHEILRRAGKIAVDVQRDVPGFIWNRLQMAVLREAIWLVDNGVASIDAIDLVTQLGLARRWRHTGLFESVFLGGGRNWETVAHNLFPVLSTADRAEDLANRIEAASPRWTHSRRRRDLGLARDQWSEPQRPNLSGNAG